MAACSWAATSAPRASAWRSTALVVTCNPASKQLQVFPPFGKGGFAAHHRRSRPVQGGARDHLHGFQIQTAGLASSGKDHCQQRLYFLHHFPLHGLRRFFSCSAAFPS
jgi:hypothetical protein